MSTLEELAADLRAGRTTATELVEACLAAIDDPAGEGSRTFLDVEAEQARVTASAIDALRRVQAEPSPYAGIPISVKDLFDIRGRVTRAGSRVLHGPPASQDATAVLRLRQAGFILIGRTNMTEFAFSGLGINPHYGTPANPWDREHRRIPGGSSSGAAVSLTDGMAHGAIGSDTGGSCRIPAALCGLVGFKPTQRRIPRDGTVPLSPTLDSLGVLGHSVVCCADLDAILSGATPTAPLPTRRARLAIPQNYVLDGLDAHVATAFERLCSRLSAAGAQLVEVELASLHVLPEIQAGGGFPAAEAFAWHRELIERSGDEYDPRVLTRIRRGANRTAEDLISLSEQREHLIASASRDLRDFDAFICPTVPVVAPMLRDLEDEDEYTRVNLLMLRNPTVVNLIDGCAVSVPMHMPDEPPSGVMVAGLAGSDAHILTLANWIEEHI